MKHRPLLFGKEAAANFAHFMAYRVCGGYHVAMISTNLAFLVWLGGLCYAAYARSLGMEQPGLGTAGILGVASFCNFFAAATTRFNDSGFTSGLTLFLPPFFICNWVILVVGSVPTMVLSGALLGQTVAASQMLLSSSLATVAVVICSIFFYDAWVWLPQVGYLGGAGSSEGFESSYQRAGILPAIFGGTYVFAAATTPLLALAGLPSVLMTIVQIGIPGIVTVRMLGSGLWPDG